MAREFARNARAVEQPQEDPSAWQRFVLTHGSGALNRHLAAVLGRSVDEIERAKHALGPSGPHRKKRKKGKSFEALFLAWNGRPPADGEWPAPAHYPSRNGYEWQQPELALLATLVGELGVQEIAQVLTERLRRVTGNKRAGRNRLAVQNQITRIGLTASDVVGGITLAAAGREIGSYSLLQNAVRQGQLKTRRVGRLIVVPHAAWKQWKASARAAPEDFVQLSTLRKALGISSDSKLPEFASMGYVPGAIQVKPFGQSGAHTTHFGTWYIPKATADTLIADRQAGRPMPWHGKPLRDNLKATFRLWEERKHPQDCETCRQIWGAGGAPGTFDDYVARYPQLEYGAKRHLTRVWTPGLTVDEVARSSGRAASFIKRAIANGALNASKVGRITYITRTEATRWVSRHCPSGAGEKSWLAFETAMHQHHFSRDELEELCRTGKLASKIGTEGTSRGVRYVARHQCAQLRQAMGYTLEQAAAIAHMSIDRMAGLLDGVNWRGAAGIPRDTVMAAIKRAQSAQGLTVEEAAEAIGAPLEWVLRCVADGVVAVRRNAWDERAYLTDAMIKRLKAAQFRVPQVETPTPDWVRLSEAAGVAGVSTTTLIRWGEAGDVRRLNAPSGWHYHLGDVQEIARDYWRSPRLRRARPPAWLREELETGNVRILIRPDPLAAQPWIHLTRVSIPALVALRATVRERQGKEAESKRFVTTLLATQFARLKDMDLVPFAEIDAPGRDELVRRASEFAGTRVSLPA